MNNFNDIRTGNIKQPKGSAGKLVAVIVVCIIATVLLLSSFTIVPAGNTGVILTLGKVSNTSFGEGFHLKVPFIQNVENMSNKIQVYETPASAVSKDLQTISSNIAVNYRLVSDKAADMYQNVGTEYQTVLIAPVVQECMKSATAKYTAEQLITERQAVGDEVKSALDSKLNSYGIYIEKFNIVNFDFSAEFNNAIEAKQVAEQNLLKTETEQKQAITVAEAQAKQKVIAAEANANAILAEAEAQAEANRLLEASLSDKVIAYEQIDKWDGVMPKVVSGDSNGMLININPDDLGSSSAPYTPPVTTQDNSEE
ncbi:MAG: prohibitin family protein [Ruminococcus sp.]|nr:prohibitin family protein [Ruminococcus sp.]